MKKLFLAALLSVVTVPAMADFSAPTDDMTTIDSSYDTMDRHDRRRDRDDRDDRYDRDRGRGRGRFQCVAENRFRQRFVGIARRMGEARREAMYSCERRSFSNCRIVGCFAQ